MKAVHTIFILLLGCLTFAEATSIPKDALSLAQQRLIPIASFTATGDMEKLTVSLHKGLDDGLSINEIKEAMIQLYAYAGFPRSLNALGTFEVVLKERLKQGKNDMVGKEASALPYEMNKNAYGAKVRAELLGQKEIPSPTGYQLFAPSIDTFLKEHLFADIFARDVLDFQTRELVTISALSAMAGVNAQLKSHLNVSMNVGLSEAQMRVFIEVLNTELGTVSAKNAEALLIDVLKNRKERN